MKRKLKKQAKTDSKRQIRTLDAAELAQVSGGTYYVRKSSYSTTSSNTCYGNCSAG